MNLYEKTISETYVYQGKIISLRVDEAELPDGAAAKREVVEHGGGVCVAALTENRELLMVRQFRYPYKEVILEIPAGKLEKGEEPPVCGLRELKEETGFSADTLFSLGALYPSPGYCGEIIHMFAAKDLTAGECAPDRDEFLECEKIPFHQAVEMVLSGEIKDAKTQTAILKLNELFRKGVFSC